jgi:hypothetical protein
MNTYTSTTNTNQQYVQYNKNTKSVKPLLFLDIDDVILDSHEALITILNRKFRLTGTSNELSMSDIKEWNFKTVLSKINAHLNNHNSHSERQGSLITDNKSFSIPLGTEYIMHIFETDEFWKMVKPKKGIYSLFNSIQNKYHIYFLTKGTKKNIELKKRWFDNSMLGAIEHTFIAIPFESSKEKAIYDEMASFIAKTISRGVNLDVLLNTLQITQVDDNYSNLSTELADLNILIKERETDYNQTEDLREDLYIVYNTEELEQVLEFYSTYDFTSLEEINPKRKTLMNKIKNIIKSIKEN